MLPAITVDVGTTSVKLCAFDADGALTDSDRRVTPTVTDAWGEVYDIVALQGIVTDFIRNLEAPRRASVQRISITGVGESGGLVRPDLTLASPMILWHDHRGAARLARLDAEGRSRVYRVTGLPANANYGLSKVAWALERATPADQGALWLNVSEYLAAWMTGERWSEYSLASRTLALDVERGTWSAEVCALFDVDPAVFPDLRAAGEGAPVSDSFAAQTGLRAEVRVHVAGHDHIVGAVGADLRAGEMLNSTGTTEGLLFLRTAPSLDERSEGAKLANGISCTGREFTLFASIPTGGSAFATLQSLLGLDAEELTTRVAALHARYVAGEIDLARIPLVLPQFRGSPPPEKRASARGMISGIGSATTADDIVFGCFLGLALQFRDVLELFPERPERIKVIGPASRNPLWLQLKADLLGTPLSVSRFPEVVSRGAQALASGDSWEWASSDPLDITVDPARQAELGEWYRDVRPEWEHMKKAPGEWS